MNEAAVAKFLFYHTAADVDFLPSMKPMLSGHRTILRANSPVAVTEMLMDAKKSGVRQIITTNPAAVSLLRPKLGSQDDFAGSIIQRGDVEFLILNPANHLYSVPYGKFLFERYLSKFTKPEKWFKQTDFKWELANENTIADLFELLCISLYCAVDIETATEDRRVTCVSYTCVYLDNGNYATHTFVIPCISLYWLDWIKKCNDTSIPKIFQNGKYDNAYFFRFNAPLRAWYFDTINLFHSWYCELPKRLDFVTSFAVRNVEYWKREGQSGNLEDYYRYNARDGWATANSFISLIGEVPDYAIRNYLQEFPLVFPCHQAEMTGIQTDPVTVERLRAEQEVKLEDRRNKLGVMVNSPIALKGKLKGKYLFNPSSPLQVKRLMKVLGCDTSKGTGEIQQKKAMFQHPLNTIILDKVLEFRKARKLIGTYLVSEKFWKNRCYYALNPHGTDTDRLASTESQYSGWGNDTTLAGLQIQNIPRDRPDIEVKSMFVSDDDFLFGEADYKQAEARDVAYLSGDKALLATVNSSKDFHAINVERFFGVSYEKVYDDTTGKVLDKILRDLSKRVNHGSNYNMGWRVLVDTMGLDRIYQARDILKLPKYWSLKQIAEFLLKKYEEAYPGVKGAYYEHIIYTVKTTKQLVSPLGWTRYCFGNPEKNRQDLNAYIAHPSQNLNAGTLNMAWMRIFKEVALNEPRDFKLCAQIHDSVLFQYRKGREDLVRRVAECMLFTVKVKDCFGIERDLRVPVDVKAGARVWSEIDTIELPNLKEAA